MTVTNTDGGLNWVTYGNGIFVAVGGDGGTKGLIYTSSDGSNWTSRTSGTTNTLWSVAFGNGQFVAVGESGTILSSTDGVSWSSGDSNASYGALYWVAFGNNMFAFTTSSGDYYAKDAPPPATVTTGSASSIAATGATLNGTVNANGNSTTVTFDYGTTTGYGSSATAAQSPVTGSSNTAVSASVSPLTCNTTYHFRVKGVNAGGTTTGSDNNFTTGACNTAPTFVGATTTLTVNQNASATDIKGLLHVSDTDSSQTETWSQNVGPSHGTLSFSGATASSGSTDIPPGGTITYTPTAGYAGSDSFIVQVSDGTDTATRTITVSVVPPAPAATVATSVTATGFSATWGSVTGATGYKLDVSASNTFGTFVGSYNNLDVGNVTTSAITGLTAGTTYYYRVRAYAGSVTSTDSNTITTLTLPAASTATAATSITATGFTANWGNVTGATGYRLDVATDNSFTSILPSYTDLDVGNVTTSAVSGLTAGTTYYYRIKAYNGSGTGANSNTITTPTLPGAATATAATTVTATGLTANWGSVTGATTYKLDVSTSNTFGTFVGSYNNLDVGNVTTYAVTGLTAGTTYYYRVRAANGSGSGSDSNIITTLTVPDASVATAATSVTTTGFTATWGSVTSATGYRLDVATDNGFSGILPSYNNLDVGNVTTSAVTGLTAGTTYYYRIKAYNGSGTGANSNTITTPTLPGAATATAATTVTATGFTANWGSVTGTTAYKLDVATDNGFASILPGYNNTDVGNVTTYAVTGLTAGTTYYYRVRAANGSGSGASSNTITVLSLPGASTATAATSITANGFTATWGSVTSATGYYLDVATDIGFGSILPAYNNTDVGNVTTSVVSGLTAGTTYYYRVRAYNATGTGANSNTITTLTLPGASTATAATSVTTTGFSANWGSVTSATSYKLDVATDSGFTSFVTGYNNTDMGNVTTSAISGLTAGTTYYYRVRAADGSGSGANSNTITVLTLPGAATATAATSVTATGFSANWGNVAGATGYKLDMATDSGFTSFVTGYNNTDVGNVTTSAVTGLTANTAYYYRVRAYDGSGTGANSNTITVLTATAAPTATSATTITYTGFTAAWNSVTGATGYYLDVATDSGFTSILPGYANLNVANVTTKAVTGLTASTTYYYRVRAYNSGGTSASSNTITATTATARVVTSSADSGTGSLRQTIGDANPGDAITFDSSLNGQTVTLASPLAIARDLTISGPGAGQLTISGANAVQIFQVNAGVTFTLEKLTLANGAAANGAALSDTATSTTTVTGCVFTGNSATNNGGAIHATGTMTVSDTLFSANSATASGGAIHNDNAAQTLTLTNVTLSGNSAANGGGIYNNSGTATITNATIAVNNATTQGGGIEVAGGTLTLHNSIVANNTASSGPDISGTGTSQGYNLVRDTSGATFTTTTGDLTGSDPLLGALAANGGPTRTMALLSGSPAIDAANCASGPTADQRGLARPQDATCDMGAYERGLPATLTATGGTPQTAAPGAAFGAPLTVKVVDSLGGVLDGVAVSYTGPASGAGITVNGSASTDASGSASYGVTANATPGPYTVTAAVNSLSAGFSLSNGKLDQSIAFTPPATATYGAAAITLSATGGASGNPVTFAVTSGPGSLSGSLLTITGAGSIVVTASQAGNATYNAAPDVPRTISVAQAGQTVAFGSAPTVVVNGTGTVNATATSGLAVTYSSTTPNVCTVSGTTVTGVTAGTCTIAANQAGNANYTAANQVTQNITIGKAGQTVTFGTAPTVVVNGTGTVSATATSGLAVAYSSTTPAVCTVSGTTVTGVTAGTCTIAADQAGNANYNAANQVTQTIAIGKGSQTVTFGTTPTVVVSGTGTVSATATSGLAVTYSSTTPNVCTVSGTTVTGVTAGTCTIAADQAGNANYNAAVQVTQTITISKGTQSIGTIGFTPATLAVGGTTTVNATATSRLAVTYTSITPAVCTVSGATVTGVTAGGCTIAADQAGDADYTAATRVTLTITIGKGSQTIGAIGFTPAALTVGGTVTASATATSGLAVTFASTTQAVCTISGSTVTGVSPGPCTITATQAGNSDYSPATTSQTITVAYATTPPHLVVSALSDGAVTTDTTQNISGTVTDPAGIKSLTVSATTVQVNPDGSFSFPVQLLAGANTITVVATNNAGITATDTRIITLDATAPKLSVTYPPDNAIAVQQNVTVTGTIESLFTGGTAKTTAKSVAAPVDPTLVVTWSVNGSAPQTASLADTTYSFTTGLGSGMNTIQVSANNAAGQKVEAKRTVSYQPAFSLAITDPAADIRTPLGSYTLTGTISDNTTPVSVTITMDGQTYTPTVTNGVFQQQLIFSDAQVYQVAVTGADQNNNSLTVQRNIIYTVPKATGDTGGQSTPFTIVDALQALQMAVGIITPTNSQTMRLDVAPMVNGVSVGDGKVDIQDAMVILRMAVGLIQ